MTTLWVSLADVQAYLSKGWRLSRSRAAWWAPGAGTEGRVLVVWEGA